jgi:hypothetical protein
MNAQSIPANDEEVNGWFYVEVFGHTQLAGRVTTRKFGSSVMFQVDVPKGETEFSHSQLFSPSSIFSMTPTTEEYCRKFAEARMKHQYAVLPYIPSARQLGMPAEEMPGGYEDDEPFEVPIDA